MSVHVQSARPRPLVVDPVRQLQRCATCDARGHSVCNAIEDKDLGRLAASAVQLKVGAGQGFVEEGDTAEHFFNITSGTAKLFKLLPDGRRQITGFASSGDFLGLAVSKAYAFSAEAIDEVQLCRFSRSKLRLLLDDFPKMEQRLLEVASNELVAAQDQMLLLGRKTARERLASFLTMRAHLPQHLCPADASAPKGAVRLRLPMTRGDIADYLGLTIETVSRTLTKLRGAGLIAVPNASEVVIPDLAALDAIAGGED